MKLSGLLIETAAQLLLRTKMGDRPGPEELQELALCLNKWGEHAAGLELAAGCAAYINAEQELRAKGFLAEEAALEMAIKADERSKRLGGGR